MKFKVERTSVWDDEVSPCKGVRWEQYTRFDIRRFRAFEEFDKNLSEACGTWLSEGVNHCINEEGYIQREFPNDGKGWFLEFESLEDLVKFANKYGAVIIRSSSQNPSINVIEIYDDYRE